MTINPVNRRDEQRRTPKRCEMKAIAQGLEEQYKGKMSYVLPTTKGKRQPWLSVFQLPPHKRRSPGRLIPLLEWGGSLSNNQQETKQHCLRGGKASGRKCRLLGRAGDYSPLLINTRATCSNREAPPPYPSDSPIPACWALEKGSAGETSVDPWAAPAGTSERPHGIRQTKQAKKHPKVSEN